MREIAEWVTVSLPWGFRQEDDDTDKTALGISQHTLKQFAPPSCSGRVRATSRRWHSFALIADIRT